MRDQVWVKELHQANLPNEIQAAILSLKDCAIYHFPEEIMDVIDDLLTSSSL
jgi:hypothetical protein